MSSAWDSELLPDDPDLTRGTDVAGGIGAIGGAAGDPDEADYLASVLADGPPDGDELSARRRLRAVNDPMTDLSNEERMQARRQLAEERADAFELDELAHRIVAERRSANRPRIADGVIDGDDLDSIEAPQMLMGSLIPELGVGFLSGRSGAYKSFLAASWACCLATGRAWLGDLGQFAVRRPVKTLYVAAEGSAGAAGRIRAWKAVHHESLRGKLGLYPRPILLNDAGQADELHAYVAEHGYEFVVVDTYRRSSAGSEENSSSEFGVVFEAVARLRDDLGCGVLFVDHTGHAGDGRPVGAEAKIASSDYVISAMYDGPTREPSVQRELFVIKLKDEESSGRWSIRLRDTSAGFPVVEIGNVNGDTAGDEFTDRKWWSADIVLPGNVAVLSGRGSRVAVQIARILAYVGGSEGLTKGEIVASLREAPGDAPHRSAVHRALALLAHKGITKPGGTDSRIVLA